MQVSYSVSLKPMEVPTRKRLAKIRCLQDCILCLKEQRPLPECLSYVPSEIHYQCNARCFIQVYHEPDKDSKRIRDLTGSSESKLVASGEQMCCSGAKWLKVKKVYMQLLYQPFAAKF